MLSLFRLRRTAPELERSFRAPGYPIVPGIALVLAVVCLIAMLWFNALIGALFVAFMVAGYIYFLRTKTSEPTRRAMRCWQASKQEKGPTLGPVFFTAARARRRHVRHLNRP